MHGESPGHTRGLNLRTPLYVGGVDNARIEVTSEVGVRGGFTGCISDVSSSFKFIIDLYMLNVLILLAN